MTLTTTTEVWFETRLRHVSPYAEGEHEHEAVITAIFPGRKPFDESLSTLVMTWDRIPRAGALEQIAETLLLQTGALAIRIATEEGAVEARRTGRR